MNVNKMLHMFWKSNSNKYVIVCSLTQISDYYLQNRFQCYTRSLIDSGVFKTHQNVVRKSCFLLTGILPLVWALILYFYVVLQMKNSLQHIASIWNRCFLTWFFVSTVFPWVTLAPGLWSSGKLWFLWYFTDYTSYDIMGLVKWKHCFYFKITIF